MSDGHESARDRDARRLPPPADIIVLDSTEAGAASGYVDGLTRRGIAVRVCRSPREAKRELEKEVPIALLLHLGDGAQVGLDEVDGLFAVAPRLRVIAMTDAEGARSPAFEALAAEGMLYDYHTLPADVERLTLSFGHLRGLCDLETRLSPGTGRGGDGEFFMVGASPVMGEVFANIRKFAKVDAPVLISGESGTGKELAAQAIHELSKLRHGPFVPIDCGSIPPTLIQSELFGHERGAFTGAGSRKAGLIETAEGGTLFLDEVGDLPADVQCNLLRFLQERTIQRLGSTHTRKVQARVLAATNIDLERAAEGGRFRKDLYFRLMVLNLDMPPLRERGDDVDLLARFFLNQFAREQQRPGLRLSKAAMTMIRRYPWPGNVRELISAVRRGVTMAEGRTIQPADLGLKGGSGALSPVIATLAKARAQHDKELVERALRLNRNRVQQAARDLGISRVALYRLMQRYGIPTAGCAAGRAHDADEMGLH